MPERAMERPTICPSLKTVLRLHLVNSPQAESRLLLQASTYTAEYDQTNTQTQPTATEQHNYQSSSENR